MITAKEWEAYNEAVSKIADGSASAVERAVLEWCRANPAATVAQAREAAKLIMDGQVQSYDDLASAFAAEWYDYRAEADGARLDQAVTSAVYASERTDAVARYQVRKLAREGPGAFARACGEYARNDALRALNETIIENVGRDRKRGVRFARVPTGLETCTFCLMLASRGAVYHTRESAGEFRHFHRHCDCKVVPGFEDDPDAELVEGYRPKDMRDLWRKFKQIDDMDHIGAKRLTSFDRTVMKTALSSPEIDYEKVLGAMGGYDVPSAKLENYALDEEKQPDKAKAFKGYLGYGKSDAATIAAMVYEFVFDNDPTLRLTDQYGDRLTTHMAMAGKDSRSAKVTAGWIRQGAGTRIRLTSIYVSE